ncbi:unnamed protein product [Paramecium sonneborni]|uniref:Uncharacterized protein n=1 Tax=Paramecium sonneborni TaxID=65129 RepID=A0A8S1PGU1_9CILI|nr:unnamed protein product [Paramecium sonneborni]
MKKSPPQKDQKKEKSLEKVGDKQEKQEKFEKSHKTLQPLDKVRIPRNVNFYLHFLQHPEITENDIEWVLQLRHWDANKMKELLSKIPNQPYSLADKKTIFSEKKHDVQDVKNKDNVASFMHLLNHRLGLSASGSLADFETGLRRYQESDENLNKREKGWWYIAKKDRHDFPEFPKPLKEQMELKKSFSTGKFNTMKFAYSGFEGMQELPPYTMKFKQGNCGSVKHLFGTDVRMSQGQWEEGLRDSYNKRIPIQKKNKEENKNKKKLDPIKK